MERSSDIPAHPDDGDNHVSARFESGSQALVEEVGNWIKVRGTVASGATERGWIARRYIANPTTGEPPAVTFPELDWCPPKGSPDPHPSGRLRIATWNIENLHRADGGTTFSDSVAREPVDYERIRCYTRLIDADILAVQEVDGEPALARVVDTDVYDLVVSNRASNQNTGFAYKKGLDVDPQPDFANLDVGGVRRGARIDLTHEGKNIKLMSVHLKSGCFSNSSSTTSNACTTLAVQVPVLEGWIDNQAASADPFILLGDFNRRLAEPNDLVWKQLDDSDPPNADLQAAGAEMPISCRENRFTEFIDHIVMDKRAAEWFERSSFRHMTYRQADRTNWSKISDHCPVIAEFWVK